MTSGKSAPFLLLDEIMSRMVDISVAALEMEIAVLKIQRALRGIEGINNIQEELERSLRLARQLRTPS
jgi:hypothetical protein